MIAASRRSAMASMIALVGAAALPGAADRLAAAVSAAPRLPAAKFGLLSAVADTIVPRTDTPGALETGVPKLVDALLNDWASAERRAEILAALDRIDAIARKEKGRAFAQLPAAEREALLTIHDAAALKPAAAVPAPGLAIGASRTTLDPMVGRPKQQAVQSPADALRPKPVDAGYAKLKELIVIGHYSSEAALTHDLAYEHAPGIWEPSVPIRPDTRPWGGLGLA